jgi:hypothetical protein
VTRPAPDWDALRGGISGDVILPGSSDYESVSKSAIVRPTLSVAGWEWGVSP